MKKIPSLVYSFYTMIKEDRQQVYALLKLFSQLIFHNPRIAFSILFHSLESLSSIYRYKNEGKLPLNIGEKRKELKSAKSLFILGSGPSVNEYTEVEWAHIKDNESWAFNLWLCNPFIPSVFIAQSLPELGDQDEDSFAHKLNNELKNMLKDKEEDYKYTKFFLRGDALNKNLFYTNIFGHYLGENFKDNLFHLAEMPISSLSTVSPKVLLDSLYKRGFFNAKNAIQPIPKFGSTITELISLALMIGYKEIVLCGIDMNNGGHFYDSEHYFRTYPILREMSHINNTRKNGEHEHMDKTARPYTIKDYIIALDGFAKDNFGASVYVMNESSTLYPEINKYELP